MDDGIAQQWFNEDWKLEYYEVSSDDNIISRVASGSDEFYLNCLLRYIVPFVN